MQWIWVASLEHCWVFLWCRTQNVTKPSSSWNLFLIMRGYYVSKKDSFNAFFLLTSSFSGWKEFKKANRDSSVGVVFTGFRQSMCFDEYFHKLREKRVWCLWWQCCAGVSTNTMYSWYVVGLGVSIAFRPCRKNIYFC